MDLDTILDTEEQEHSAHTDCVELVSIWMDSSIRNLAYEFQRENHPSGNPCLSLSLLFSLSSTACPYLLLIRERLTHRCWAPNVDCAWVLGVLAFICGHIHPEALQGAGSSGPQRGHEKQDEVHSRQLHRKFTCSIQN